MWVILAIISLLAGIIGMLMFAASFAKRSGEMFGGGFILWILGFIASVCCMIKAFG